MEDQHKRVLLAVVLCMGVLGIWTVFFSPKPPPPPPPTPTPTAPVAANAGATGPTSQPVAGASATSQPTGAAGAVAINDGPTPPPNRPAETTATLTTPRLTLVVSSRGGAVKSAVVGGTQYKMKTDAGRVPFDLVRTAEDERWYPGRLDLQHALGAWTDWTIEQKSETEAVAKLVTPTVEVSKTFRLNPDSYAVELEVAVKNVSAAAIDEQVSLSVYGFEDPNAPTSGGFKYVPPAWSMGCDVDGGMKYAAVKQLLEGPKTWSGAVRWTGLRHKFFLLALASKTDPGDLSTCAGNAAPSRPGVMEARLTLPTWKLSPGDTGSRKLVLYAGPTLLEQLELASTMAGGDLQLDKTIDWGPAPTKWFTFIARPMLSLLRVFHSWVGNWGVAIILLTITVKLATLYWTQKSMRSMKAMSRLKPEMDKIRDKYPDDKQKQNEEMMRLYREQNINPLGGCLPMLLQMPIWMALYSALGAAAELHQAPFVGWIRDLTAPDPHYIFPISLTVLMFVQARLSPAAVDSTQQKMMMYLMPIMFGGFSLFFPSGLTVYIFTNTLLSMAHQVYMNRTDPGAPQKATPATSGGTGSTAKVNGNGREVAVARSGRKKK